MTTQPPIGTTAVETNPEGANPTGSQEQFVLPDGTTDAFNADVDGLQSADAFPWEEQSSRMKFTTQMPEKLKALLGGDWPVDGPPKLEISDSKAQEACSEHALERIQKKVGDIDRTESKCLQRLKITRNRLVPIIRELALFYPQCSIQISGFFLYPKGGGYMGWHTNSGAACTRVYVTHTIVSDKSFFRYYSGGECVTSWDKEGWNIRQFEVTEGDKDPLWHCVYADCQRLSIGFRINKNLKPLK